MCEWRTNRQKVSNRPPMACLRGNSHPTRARARRRLGLTLFLQSRESPATRVPTSSHSSVRRHNERSQAGGEGGGFELRQPHIND